MSAVSTKLTPPSRAARRMRSPSAWSALPPAPNIIAPRPHGLPLTPGRGRRHLGPPREREPVEDHDAVATEVVAGGIEHGGEDNIALGGGVVARLEQDVADLVLVEHAGVGQMPGQGGRQRALARP